jgi:glycosyltransferase involved in cell wall biosynthesis
MIAVVVPCYRVKGQVLEVLAGIGPECDLIVVVDDACPEASGDLVEAAVQDPRVRVVRHETNQGVGGATITGYREALDAGATVLVKLDGDGQMEPDRIPDLVAPILAGEADYAKGNRFFDLDQLGDMPSLRVIGNSLLSFLSKVSSGYWDLFDPTNGFTALEARVARRLPLEKISRDYFFESDLLFRLGTLRAVVRDVPMPAIYAGEQSSLRVSSLVGSFLWRHLRNAGKRLFYGYLLRDFSFASIEILLGPLLIALGVAVGTKEWIGGALEGTVATSGTVMLAALPVILGVQLVLAFLGYDMQNVPRHPIHPRLRGDAALPAGRS